MRNLGIVLVASALAFGACKKSKQDDAPAPPAPKASPDAAPAAVKPVPDAAPGSGDAAGEDDVAMANKSGNCPSTVGGAATEVEPATQDGKVVITIVAKDDAAVKTIRARTAHLIEIQDAPAATIKHSGDGTGGGGIGLCPVVTKDTTVASEDIEGGVKVTMTPKDADVAKSLPSTVETRIREANEWTQKNLHPTGDAGGGAGVGGGQGEHGGNHQGKGDGHGKDEQRDAQPEPSKPE